MLRSSKVSHSRTFPIRTLYFSLFSNPCHMPLESHCSWSDHRSSDHEAFHCAGSSVPLLLLTSSLLGPTVADHMTPHDWDDCWPQWKGCSREQSWPDSTCCMRIWLEGLNKTVLKLRIVVVADENRNGHLLNVSEALGFEPPCSVRRAVLSGMSLMFPLWFLCIAGHCRLRSSRIDTHSQWEAVWLVLGTFAKFRKSTVIVVMSVRPSAWNSCAPTGRIFTKFDISVFFENLLRKFEFD